MTMRPGPGPDTGTEKRGSETGGARMQRLYGGATVIIKELMGRSLAPESPHRPGARPDRDTGRSSDAIRDRH